MRSYDKLKVFYGVSGITVMSVLLYLIHERNYHLAFKNTTDIPVFNNVTGHDFGHSPEPNLNHEIYDVHYKDALSPDFWNERPLTVHEAFSQHGTKTLESCETSCDSDRDHCDVSNKELWDTLTLDGELRYKPFLARGQYVFPWEKTYLSRPPLDDAKTLPDLNLSRVTVEGVANGVVRCNIFDTVHGRVDLVDANGNLRTSGDDEVRVWVKSVDEGGYAASGNVTDLKNGSYFFTFRCLWPGNSTLNVALAYPREFIRVAIHQTHIGVTRFLGMTFSKEGVRETTLCWSTPNIPGRDCVCNLTEQNMGPFYCGRPIDPRLSCDNWVATEFLKSFPPPHDVTSAELLLIRNCAGYANATLINHSLEVFTETIGSLPKLPPCNETSPGITWDSTMPKGFWSPGTVWNSLQCQSAENVTAEWAWGCLQNTTVWIFGDSNANRTYTSFVNITGCQNETGLWPNPATCSIPEIGFSITTRSHENPRYVGIYRSRMEASVSAVLDSIPSAGRHLVIVHYYFHFSPAHLSVLYLHMESLRAAIERLLKRNVNAVVALRGPHISTRQFNDNHAIGGDSLAPRYVDIIRSRFKGLEGSVIFLDAWDMSIGIENQNVHPIKELPRELVKHFISFLCN